jgi:transcription-repair coupling factor (superfamily II helicase)
VAIKGLCRQANVSKIDVGPKGAVVSFRNDAFPNPLGLITLVQQKPADWRVRPDNRVVVKGEWDKPDARLNAAERILGQLAKVALAA